MPKSKLNSTTEGQEWKKPGRSILGAPSQHFQSSRKGKRAWRKNVNIEDVEKGLESIRTEERVTGCGLYSLCYIYPKILTSVFKCCFTKDTRQRFIPNRLEGG